VVVALLREKGISKRVADKLDEQFDEPYVRQKIAYHDFLVQYKPDKIKNPKGWLRRAIEDDFGAPDGFVSPEEMEKKRQAEQEEQERFEQIRRQREAQTRREEAQKQEQKEQQLADLYKRYKTPKKLQEFWQDLLTTTHSLFLANTHLLSVQDGIAYIAVSHRQNAHMLETRGINLVKNALSVQGHDVEEIKAVVMGEQNDTN
ncbi:MAG: hypothetical protein KDE51_27070, partial [Anaerolineales bacterium]|nr:hypothetical protein [Anaerolineales bacterium]